MTDRVLVGSVAYDAKVVPIWEGIREHFRGAPVEMDVVWFSNYRAQVKALPDGWIDIGWNTNLAYVRVHGATNGAARLLAMRDTDVGFRTLLVGRDDALAPQVAGQAVNPVQVGGHVLEVAGELRLPDRDEPQPSAGGAFERAPWGL